MNIEQIYTGCLAQGSYYIFSNGEAAVIDPLREVSPYIERAKKDGVTIKYVFETHFHADFVSGHVTLAEKTGADIIYGPNAAPNFKAVIAEDNQEFSLGKLTFRVLHTPGHTMESTTYLLLDENGKETAIFTGDTLFLGDVGRPDLAQKTAEITQEDLAGILFDSLRNKIMPLPDHLVVYPAHGAGSACGKNMMKETTDLLGNQKKVNYALRANMTRDEFIREVTHGLTTPPKYFPLNVKMNKEGYQSIDRVLQQGLTPLDPNDLEQLATEVGALVLDVRDKDAFCAGHIPQSIFIGLDDSFAPWVGELIVDTLQPIVLVTEEGREEEAVTRLSRVGFDNTLGYLKGGIAAWQKAGKDIDSIISVDPTGLSADVKASIFDVRRKNEYLSERMTEAVSIPLSDLNERMKAFPVSENFYLYCGSGYRSVIAASMLKARGIHNLVNLRGGFKAIKQSGLPISDFICPTTL